MQWKIQDFPDGGANWLFDQIFAENCMEMKEFEMRGEPRVPSTPPRLKFTTQWDGKV